MSIYRCRHLHVLKSAGADTFRHMALIKAVCRGASTLVLFSLFYYSLKCCLEHTAARAPYHGLYLYIQEASLVRALQSFV